MISSRMSLISLFNDLPLSKLPHAADVQPAVTILRDVPPRFELRSVGSRWEQLALDRPCLSQLGPRQLGGGQRNRGLVQRLCCGQLARCRAVVLELPCGDEQSPLERA